MEIGEVYYLVEAVKGYRRVEVVAFFGKDILVRTESGWDFSVREDELVEE